MLSLHFKDASGSHAVNFHPVSASSDKTITINEKHYKLRGRDADISSLHSHITSTTFETLDTFTSAVSHHIDPTGRTTALFQDIVAGRNPIYSQIENSVGTRFAIEQLLKKLPVEEHLQELLDLTKSLINKGELKKASNLFFYIQSHLNDHERIEQFMQIGNAFMRYSDTHQDILALDCAEFHFCMTRENGGEPLIKQAHDKLKEFMVHGNEEQQSYARNLLDKILIDDLMDNSSLDQAFTLAATYQNRIDTVDAPKPYHKNSRIIQVPDGEQTLSMHAIITGKRNPGDPVVILEPGLGCISADWQLVQEQLPPDILAVSYDREGMAWSEKNAEASPERSISNLRNLLQTCNLEPPYIFVGHSYGGFLGQLYALEYPDEIAGMVLVDSALEIHTPDPVLPPQDVWEQLPPAAQQRFVANHLGDFLDTKTACAVSTIRTTTNQQKTFEEESNTGLPHARDLLLEKLKDNPTPFSFPLKVLTAGVFVPNPDKTEEENNLLEKTWETEQKLLPNRSSSDKSAQIDAPQSDHFIMYYDHTLIAEQINSLFKQGTF